jgi:hypothetical protein
VYEEKSRESKLSRQYTPPVCSNCERLYAVRKPIAKDYTSKVELL